MKSRIADFQQRTAPEVERKDEAWFMDQLSAHCAEVVPKGKDFLILCPFHPDSNPSLGVDRHTGVFNCFACGAGGHWNKLAEQIGAEKLKRKGGKGSEAEAPLRDAKALRDTLTRSFNKAGIVDPNKKVDKVRPIVSPWRPVENWRDVAGDFLVSIGCVRVVDLVHNVVRIGLPVRNVDGDLLGYTCRAVDPEDASPKYTPLAADRIAWRKKELPARSALFLIDQAVEHDWTTVVLVEGPYDALRLYAAGIPALAILGTENWTAEKAALIVGLGIRNVITLMDNDRAGGEATEAVMKTLKSSGVLVTSIRLPEGVKDPGLMSAKQIKWLQQKVANVDGSTT